MRLCIIIIVICLVLMSSINIFQTVRNANKENAMRLKQIADMANDITEKYIDTHMLEQSVLYGEAINKLAEGVEGTIVVADKNGNVFNVSAADVVFPSKIEIDKYADVLQGVATYRTGAFNDIFKFNTFSVASPFVLNGTVQGVIFVITKNQRSLGFSTTECFE